MLVYVTECFRMQPLIRDDQPARNPTRGPLDQAAPVSTPAGVDALIEENNQLLLLTEEILNGRTQGLDGQNADVTAASPFLERLQRNLIYLALLAEQRPNASTHVDSNWTAEEVERLRAGIQIYGEQPQHLARHVGTKSAATITQILDQWKHKQV